MGETILILGNGSWQGEGLLPELAAGADRIIAVDGGFAKASKHGIRPDLVIGDLDSLSQGEREELERSGLEVIAHPAEKDQTDLELALDWAIARRPDRLILFGVLGERLDQTLASVFLLEKAVSAGIAGEIVAGRERLYLLRGGGRLELAAAGVGDLISLIPLSAEVKGIRTWGLKYPLEGESLQRASSRGISNEVVEIPAGVEVEEGLLLVLVVHTASTPSFFLDPR